MNARRNVIEACIVEINQVNSIGKSLQKRWIRSQRNGRGKAVVAQGVSGQRVVGAARDKAECSIR